MRCLFIAYFAVFINKSVSIDEPADVPTSDHIIDTSHWNVLYAPLNEHIVSNKPYNKESYHKAKRNNEPESDISFTASFVVVSKNKCS